MCPVYWLVQHSLQNARPAVDGLFQGIEPNPASTEVYGSFASDFSESRRRPFG